MTKIPGACGSCRITWAFPAMGCRTVASAKAKAPETHHLFDTDRRQTSLIEEASPGRARVRTPRRFAQSEWSNARFEIRRTGVYKPVAETRRPWMRQAFPDERLALFASCSAARYAGHV